MFNTTESSPLTVYCFRSFKFISQIARSRYGMPARVKQ